MTDIAEAVLLPHLLDVCREAGPNIFFSTVQLLRQIDPRTRRQTPVSRYEDRRFIALVNEDTGSD
jgi:hypothetical protein